MSLKVSKKKPQNTIKILAQKRIHVNENKIPRRYQDREPVQLYFQKGTIKTTTNKINTIKKITKTIYEQKGAGEYNLLFWGAKKNPRYNPKKRCTPKKGNHKHCNKRSCKKNRKIIHNWTPRARVTIKETPLKNPPYNYEWEHKKDQMNKFPWWKEE